MKHYDRKSVSLWDQKWREALERGRCVYGCYVENNPCKHLDRYLEMTGVRQIDEPSCLYTDDIDLYAAPSEEKTRPVVEGTYRLFRKLREFGLRNDQVLLVLYHAVLEMSFRDVQAALGYTSLGTTYNEYRRAMRLLKTKGYQGGEVE